MERTIESIKRKREIEALRRAIVANLKQINSLAGKEDNIEKLNDMHLDLRKISKLDPKLTKVLIPIPIQP